MEQQEYISKKKNALNNNINVEINDSIPAPINQKDIEDWAKWSMNNVPNNKQRKIISNFLDHYYSMSKVNQKETTFKGSVKLNRNPNS